MERLMIFNALIDVVAAGVSSSIILGVIYVVRYIKYSMSEEGKLHRKIDKKKSALYKISHSGSQKDFVNKELIKELIKEKKQKISNEIKDDILQYQLNTNNEYIQLKALKKQGVLDENSFQQAVNKIKHSLNKITDDSIKIIELENGENLKVKESLKNTLKHSKLLSHLDLYNEQLLFTKDNLIYISDNKIKNIYTTREYKNGLLFAQQKNIISSGDILLKPKKEFNNDLIEVLPFCYVRIKKDEVAQVYWVKKGKTLNKKNVEIYQKNKSTRTFNDLVFVNSVKSRDGFHFMNLDGTLTIVRTKNGKIA